MVFYLSAIPLKAGPIWPRTAPDLAQKDSNGAAGIRTGDAAFWQRLDVRRLKDGKWCQWELFLRRVSGDEATKRQ